MSAQPGPSNAPQQGPISTTQIINTLRMQFARDNNNRQPSFGELGQLVERSMDKIMDLLKQSRITQQTITEIGEFVKKSKTPGAAHNTQAPPGQPHPFSIPSVPPTQSDQSLSSNPELMSYPVFTTESMLSQTSSDPETWPAMHMAQSRPTLTGGIAAGRMSGTPAYVRNPAEDPTLLAFDDPRGGAVRRKSMAGSQAGEQNMRRSIQDLVVNIDPSVRIDPEVEDLLLNIADEFIDSVTNFSCRLAKHRGGQALEVRDLQLHLERNHGIRIPGYSSSASSTAVPPFASSFDPASNATANKRKDNAGASGGRRSQRLVQVANAKRTGA